MNGRSVILEQDDQVCNKKKGKYFIEDTVYYGIAEKSLSSFSQNLRETNASIINLPGNCFHEIFFK